MFFFNFQVDMANNDENSTDQVHAVQSIRKILSANNSPPIDKLIRLGVIPVLLKCLTKDDDHLLQFESTWALTNIASGTSRDTYEVVKAGAVPLLINLLSSPYTNVCEQALWALGNITGDSPNLRDLVIQAGIIPRLLIFVPQALPSSFLQTIAWVFTNLCRSKEMPPSVEVIREILPALKYQIVSSDQKVIIDTAWALSYLTDYGNDKIELVVQSGVIPYLVPLLSHNETKLKTAALRALGNIVTGTDEQTQAVLDCGILSHFAELLTHTSQKIRKESIWLLSNITAGNERQIQMVLNAQLLPMILENLTHGEYYTKKEAAWCVGNLTVSGSRTQIMELIRFNAIAPFCEMLKCGDSQIIATVLDGIQNILNVVSFLFKFLNFIILLILVLNFAGWSRPICNHNNDRGMRRTNNDRKSTKPRSFIHLQMRL